MKHILFILSLSLGGMDAFISSVAIRSAPSGPVNSDKGAAPKKTLKKITSYEEAFQIVNECAVRGESNDDLYSAVHYIDANAHKLYPNLDAKEALWDRAHGSWKLVLSTGSAKSQSFHPPPRFLPFSYAMIGETYFGNGVGLNDHTIWLSLLHKHYFNPQIRQMVMTLQDIYLRGHKATNNIPAFLRNKANVGKRPEDFYGKPPCFVIIGASDKALIARGNQSGGFAIWSRMAHDIQPIAYKDN